MSPPLSTLMTPGGKRQPWYPRGLCVGVSSIALVGAGVGVLSFVLAVVAVWVPVVAVAVPVPVAAFVVPLVVAFVGPLPIVALLSLSVPIVAFLPFPLMCIFLRLVPLRKWERPKH